MNSGIYQTYGALLVSALLPVIAGSSSSLKAPKFVRDTLKVDQSTDEDEDEDDSERITTTDALYFPLLASVSLGSLYLAFKYLNKDTINKIMGYYFSIMGIGSLSRSGIALSRAMLSRERYKRFDKFKLVLEKNSKPYTYLSFNYIHLTSLLLSIVLTVVNFKASHWSLSNLVALVFSWNAISLVKLDSFATGFALLGGLFFYDIYWVFFSEVMVKVATNFDAPIKIVWPRGAGSTGFSLLGLGDIVVPGIFIALALRFDYHLAVQRQTPAPFPSGRYPKPYFFSCFFAYITGLITCIYVMHTFKAAQPALLYLSPLCSLSVTIVALVKGEFKEFWAFEEGSEHQKSEDEKQENYLEEKKEDSAVSTAVEEIGVSEKRVLRSRASK